jgi:hypothetical protein
LDEPSRASRAIWASWAVSGSLSWPGRIPLTGTVRLRDVAAGGQQLAPGPFGKWLHSHAVQQLPGSAQLLVRIEAAALAAEPLAVKQMAARHLGAQPGLGQALD